MSFVKMIIGLPLIVIIAVFAFVNNDMAVFSLWPFNMEITVSLSVAVIFFIVFGYIVGKLDSWLSYAPLRRAGTGRQGGKPERRPGKRQKQSGSFFSL